MIRPALLIAALLASPLPALAQTAPQPPSKASGDAPVAREPAVISAWRFRDPGPPPQRPWIATDGRRMQTLADHFQRIPQETWAANEGLRFTGSRLAFSRRF